MSEEDILMRLHRHYSKDEYVSLLKKEISTLNFRNGELISEVSELKFELNKYKNGIIKNNLKTKKVWSRDELIKQYDERFIKQRQKNAQLEKDLNEWRNKYFSLKLINEKLLSSEQKDERSVATKMPNEQNDGKQNN